MVIRNLPSKRGAVSIQLLVILVPVLFGFMGFALDLGQLYLVRGEINQAANAMALAAAKQLIGTSASTDYATNAALLSFDNSNSNGNKFNFGSQVINDDSGFLQSNAPTPLYFAAAADAMSTDPNSSGSTADGTTAQYAQANITADAPLTFWALLTLGQSRKTTVAARAVAGISAPVCTACGIEPFAIAPIDATDLVNFGYTIGTEYTFGYVCTGFPTPAPLTGTAIRVPYLIINRYDTGSTFDETQQLFRIGAQGLIPSTTQTQGCLTVNNPEVVWATALPAACNAASPAPSVSEMLCGLSTRMDINTPTACSLVSNLSDVSAPYLADTDVSAITDYTTYVGDTRRIITVPIVDTLSSTGNMTVQGFREFLMEASPGTDTNIPTDPTGRFIALYIGSVAPVKQGRFDGGCEASSGPGKVVLFQ